MNKVSIPQGHTPGPWEASCRDGTLKVRGPADAKKYKQREICRCYGSNRADVDLIRAAPDLIAACKALTDWVDANVVTRAAIAKAEGGA